MAGNDFSLWTVYEKPADYPAQWVARRHTLVGPTAAAVFALSLDAVCEKLPPGLYCIPRQPDDEPCIVETWL